MPSGPNLSKVQRYKYVLQMTLVQLIHTSITLRAYSISPRYAMYKPREMKCTMDFAAYIIVLRLINYFTIYICKASTFCDKIYNCT